MTSAELLTLNTKLRTVLYQFLDGSGDVLTLKSLTKLLHNHQWSARGNFYNIMQSKTNCANDCKYCYMKPMKKRFGQADLEDFAMGMDDKKVAKKWRAGARPGPVLMFPSSHDIFPQFVDDYIAVVQKILASGRQVLVVTKPRLDVVRRLVAAFGRHPDVTFRFTITTADDAIRARWEHGAPSIDERMDALRFAFGAGCKTSVSIEPCLSDPMRVVEMVAPFVNDEIWIGGMSDMNKTGETDDEYARLTAIYSNWRRIIAEARASPFADKIFWKTSVCKALMR